MSWLSTNIEIYTAWTVEHKGMEIATKLSTTRIF